MALKLIKRGLDSQRVIAGFEAERQALALTNYPNIARVIDAGTTEVGLMVEAAGVEPDPYPSTDRLTGHDFRRKTQHSTPLFTAHRVPGSLLQSPGFDPGRREILGTVAPFVR